MNTRRHTSTYARTHANKHTHAHTFDLVMYFVFIMVKFEKLATRFVFLSLYELLTTCTCIYCVSLYVCNIYMYICIILFNTDGYKSTRICDLMVYSLFVPHDDKDATFYCSLHVTWVNKNIMEAVHLQTKSSVSCLSSARAASR